MFLCVLLPVLLLVSTPTSARDVIVVPELLGDCSTPLTDTGSDATVNITQALANASSNTTFLLQNGCHVIDNFSPLQDLTDVRLIGSSETTVKCESDMGLAFVNITRIQLVNITISDCGLSGSGPYLRNVFEITSQSLDLFHNFTLGTKVGVFIADCSDLVMTGVTIRNTSGIGLVAINLMGTTEIHKVNFTENAALQCNRLYGPAIHTAPNVGGGLYILYTDYLSYQPQAPPVVRISEACFMFNHNCNPLTATLSQQLSLIRNNYPIGSSGGLGITLTQAKFAVNISVASAVFEENTAPYGGGAHVILYQGVSRNLVTFHQCIFRKNGYRFEIRTGFPTVGGGLATHLNLPLPLSRTTLQNTLPSELFPNTLLLTNSTFVANEGITFAGLYVRSFNSPLTTTSNQNKVILSYCRLLQNRSPSFAAFGAQSIVYNGAIPGMLLEFEDIIVEENDVASFSAFDALIAGATERTAVMTLDSVNLTISGNSQFFRNKGAALLLARSTIRVSGDLRFVNNSGGGVMLIDVSNIILLRNSKLSFIRNTATSKGGAIYVDLTGGGSDNTANHNCFLWFATFDPLCFYYDKCLTIDQINASLVFENNRAPLGGTIYGSTLNNCPWAVPLIIADPKKFPFGVRVLETFSSVTFDPPPINSSVISTDPFIIEHLPNRQLSAKPGELVPVSLTARDLFIQSVPAAIGSSVDSSSQDGSTSRLGRSGYWFLPGLTPNPPVPAYFFGPPNSNLLVTVSGLESYARSKLTVSLNTCGFGFQFDSHQCICDPALADILNAGVTCNNRTFTLEVPPSFWLGESPKGGYIYEHCIFDYCEVGTKTVTEGGLDTQCQVGYNREGLMCAVCSPGTSALFGGNECRQCSNDWLALILVFAVAGIVLILVIAFLGFTISEGYINSLLFYSNVTSFFVAFFAPRNARIFFIVQFINLSLGFEACFFDGMTTLAKVGLQLLFPAYLFLLMLAIIILARCSSKISNAGFSAAKTFATLLLLCYTNVGQTCIEILGAINLSGKNGTYYGWYSDPTVQYGSGIHGFLVFVAVALILFYIFPFSIALLLPPLILRTKLRIKMKPLLDAFWNPFKPKLRFWLGLRAILRIIPFCLAVFVSYPTNCFLLTIFLVIVLILHERLQPFEGLWQHILDEFFLFNLLLLSVGGAFFGLIFSRTSSHLAFLSIIVILAYLTIVVIIIFHIDIRFPVIRRKMKELYLRKKLRKRKGMNSNEGLSDPMITKVEGDVGHDATNDTTYSELREPTLEYGEGEYTPP